MPTYEYGCRECSARVEVRATIAEKEAGLDPRCPSCGSSSMRRLLSAFATRSSGVPQMAGGPSAGGGCCGGGCCAN